MAAPTPYYRERPGAGGKQGALREQAAREGKPTCRVLWKIREEPDREGG